MLLALAILFTLGGAFMWMSISMSDPVGTQASADAANTALALGWAIALVFWLSWWFGW